MLGKFIKNSKRMQDLYWRINKHGQTHSIGGLQSGWKYVGN
jgi:hypothetical protein